MVRYISPLCILDEKMELIEIVKEVFGYIALTTTIIGLMPQIYKTYKTKSAKDLSMVMLWNCFICAMSWLIYGIIVEEKMVTISNILALGTSIILIIQKTRYDKIA